MKSVLLISAALLFSVIVLFFILALISRSGGPPELVHGRLMACPDRPNCVCSEYPEDQEHAVEPLPISRDYPDLNNLIGEVLSRMGGEVRVERENYVAATFSSPLFGFVDDFQVRVDPEGQQIHLRSASRVGYSDGGINRKRVVRFRQRLEAALSSAQ